jgi:hypothetical protein
VSRPPSAVDTRRLKDGATALDVSSRPAGTPAEIRAQLEVIHDGIAALQSLDDLGPEGNAKAQRDEEELWKRMKELEQRLQDLEGKKVKP